MDLLDHKLTQYMALQILLVFTHDGSRLQNVVLVKISGHSRSLSKLVQDRLNARNVIELAVVVMAHSLPSFMSSLASDSSHHLQENGLHDILHAMFGVLQSADASKALLTHALMLLVSLVQYVPDICRRDPSLCMLLVALLRVEDICARVTALEGILSICEGNSREEIYEVDLGYLARVITDTEEFAPTIASLIGTQDVSHWIEQSDSSLLCHLSNQYTRNMSQAARDQDLSALGHSIASVVQYSPVIVEGSWRQDIDGRASDQPQFSLWSDVLPECARILRLTGAIPDLDAADILDMKYLMLRNRAVEALAFARMTLSRNPSHVFAHYVISLYEDTAEGLRAAQEGLRCPDVTPFLRKQLLWRAVEFGVWKGLQQIITAEAEDTRAHDEGVTTLRAALDNANVFLAEAPIDAHLRLTMLKWRFLLELTLRGPQLSSDLHELQVRTGMNWSSFYAERQDSGYSAGDSGYDINHGVPGLHHPQHASS